MQEREIVLYEVPGGVVEVQPSSLVLADGQAVPFDHCLWTTQATAASWLADTGLPVGEGGFLLVNDFLQSDGGPPNVFAAGDVATNARNPRPKAGVFAVRAVSRAPGSPHREERVVGGAACHNLVRLSLQGPPLADNLRRFLCGEPLRAWTPQRTFLSLITAGDKYAVGTKGWLGKQHRPACCDCGMRHR